jgi:hypothetical protein
MIAKFFSARDDARCSLACITRQRAMHRDHIIPAHRSPLGTAHVAKIPTLEEAER